MPLIHIDIADLMVLVVPTDRVGREMLNACWHLADAIDGGGALEGFQRGGGGARLGLSWKALVSVTRWCVALWSSAPAGNRTQQAWKTTVLSWHLLLIDIYKCQLPELLLF